MRLTEVGSTREHDWDWKDDLYFMLGPFFGWEWETFLEMPAHRVTRWEKEVASRNRNPNTWLSLGEVELSRVVSELFKVADGS